MKRTSYLAALATLSILTLLIGCGQPTTEPAKPAPTSQPTTSPIASERSSQSAAGTTGGTHEQGDTSPGEFEGTTAKTEVSRLSAPQAELTEIRTGEHPIFDRIVFQFKGAGLPGYQIEYLKKPAENCAGEGEPITLEGTAVLQVSMMPARAHTEAGEVTVKDRARKTDLSVLKEMKSTCDFEAEATWVLGLSSMRPYRVLELSNPSRLVVDIKR